MNFQIFWNFAPIVVKQVREDDLYLCRTAMADLANQGWIVGCQLKRLPAEIVFFSQFFMKNSSKILGIFQEAFKIVINHCEKLAFKNPKTI